METYRADGDHVIGVQGLHEGAHVLDPLLHHRHAAGHLVTNRSFCLKGEQPRIQRRLATQLQIGYIPRATRCMSRTAAVMRQGTNSKAACPQKRTNTQGARLLSASQHSVPGKQVGIRTTLAFHVSQRGSLIRSQAKMVGSSRYASPLRVLRRVRMKRTCNSRSESEPRSAVPSRMAAWSKLACS